MEVRKVGDRVLTVTHLAPEDPRVVCARDCVYPERVGTRPMVEVKMPQSDSDGSFAYGRKAPKYFNS